MFKICVVGCGHMSTFNHGPSLLKYKNEYNDVSLEGCCDLLEEKAIAYKEKFGFKKHYTDYKLMFNEITPDVVCLISPVGITSRLATDIIKLGYNIILEKPPALNREEIENMIKEAEISKVSVRTAFNRRFMPLILKLKEMLKEEQEEIFNVTYQMYRYGRADKDFSTTAIHAIDAVKNIIDSDYKHINFTYQELFDIGDANIYMDCIFENNAVAQIAIVPMGGGISERITVNTKNNTYFVELPMDKRIIDYPGRLRHIKNEELTDINGFDLIHYKETFVEVGIYEENRSFFEELRKKRLICELESAIQSVEIANYIRERKQRYEK